MESDSTIDDIIKSIERFRILSVGRAGVGKSSLINRVFGIESARVAHFTTGESDIQQEFVSEENPYFVLHDSKGFEPGDTTTFQIVSGFIEQQSKQELPLKDRIHGLWLCTETPTAGGRIFEKGDENLLELAHKVQIPVVIVFTQYDRLVRTKRFELEDEDPDMDQETLDARSQAEAQQAFDICTKSLQRTIDKLNIPMPKYARVSIRPGYQEDVSALVEVTKDVVKERLAGDAWIMWAIAQRASLPVKIEACVTKGMSYYRRVLSGTIPGFGKILLRTCLEEVHKDIIKCWNYKGEALDTTEFQQLMLHLVQDVHTKPTVVSTPPSIDIISQFVSLVTAASAPIAPPVAILGLTYIFLNWLSTVVLENVHEVHSLLVAYTVDLIKVLKELFDIGLLPSVAMNATWKELQLAFEAYERSPVSPQQIHDTICSKVSQSKQILTADSLDDEVRQLLEE